ncbi:hypothetical protein D3C87_1202510 [compost metagenome]
MIGALVVGSLISMALPQELEGRWVQPCQNKAVREEVLQNNTAALTENYYLDAACSEPLLTFRNEGGLQAQDGKMDFAFTRVTIALHSSALVDDFNDRAVCGYQNWIAGLERDITGMTCALFNPNKPAASPQVGDMRYGIYKVEDNRLYFGQLTLQHNAMTPEKRPITFDPRFYIRQ